MTERILSTDHKFAVYEHLTGIDKGFRFWSMVGDHESLESMTKLNTGEVVYKVVLTTDDQDEAMEVARNGRSDADMIRHMIISKGCDKGLGIDPESVIKSLGLE